MKTIGTTQRAGAAALALGITFSIVWAVAAYAYGEPPATGPAQSASRSVQAKSCSS